MGNSTDHTGAVDITERWLEGYQLAPDVGRAKLWDVRLSGFGVIVGKTRCSFVVRAYVKGQRKRRLVTLGHWSPSKLRAADAGLRNRTMTVAQARGAAIQELGTMRAGEDPAADSVNSDSEAAGITFGAALAVHIDRMRRKGGRPSSISTVEREVARHLADWTERPLRELTRTEARELHERVTEKSGPYIANRLLRHVRAVWHTAEREHDLPRCPTVAVSWNRERRRPRSYRCSGFRNRLLDRWAWQPNVQRCRASNPTAYCCRIAVSVYAHAVTADPARISVTAKVSAYYRKFSDIAFAAEVATLIGADEAFAEIVRDHALEPDKLTFYAPMFEARYKSITQLIGECGATQVLELASGYSLRGLDLTRSSSLHYVETDLRDVVATKLELLEDLRQRHDIAPHPLHVVTVADVLDIDQLRVAAAGFDRGRPLMVLCEGLVGYLTREETGRLTRNVHSLLSEFPGGWWIVPDFAFKTDIRDLPPERIRLREAITGVTQRQLDASAFEDGDDLAAFLHRIGFDMQVSSQVDKTQSFSTIPALNLLPAVIERMRPVLRVWVMSLVPRIQTGGS